MIRDYAVVRQSAALGLALVASFLQGCQTPGATPALQKLRAEFRPTYTAARTRLESELSPLIVAQFSDLLLIKDGNVVAEGKGIPRKYHLLHRTAHVPLVIFLKLHRDFGQPLEKAVADDAAAYRALVNAATTDLAQREFTPDEIAWQLTVLRESAAFLDQAHLGAVMSREEFEDYRSRVYGPMTKLADAAGAAQIDATHAVVSEWRRTHLTEEEWSRVRVMIVGPRQPRHDYAATQYFAALFPERHNSLFPGESQRVFYVESLAIDTKDRVFEKERRTVAAILLDEAASEAIFHDPYRMSIDVMADGARRRVRELNIMHGR